jgi:hypothetical protein
MACDNGRCGDKDVKPCPACGKAVPPSLGVKPRKYCSKACCRLILRPRNLGAEKCADCQRPIRQPPEKGRKKVICKGCRLARKRNCQKQPKQTTCGRCGELFLTEHGRRFCSKRCQYDGRGEIVGDARPCSRCGKPFKGKPSQKFCSRACAHTPTIYTCLCCESPFKRKIYKGGNYSRQTKYCSRECAFEARRRKLPAAQRPLEVAGRIAGWFLSWGDDAWPVITRCRDCGRKLRTARQDECVRTACQACSAPPRRCAKCGCAASKYSPYCEPCAEQSRSEARRRARKKRRWKCNVRKRCRRYGAPYTPVSRKKILDRDKWKCQICGVKLLPRFTKMLGTGSPHPRCPTVDHIIPICLGKASPGHVGSNLQAACWECNCLKSDKPLHSFVPRYTTSLD